jgi:undecaprenyl-diphosphatase
MPFLHSLIYGAIQGLTEFLPVSSSAHLVLLPYFTGWEDPGLAFDVALHWGTLFAAVLYFRNDVIALIADAFRFLGGQRTPQTALPFKIAVATIPGGIIGFLFEKQAETLFRSPALLACTLSAMGVGLWAADRWGSKSKGLDGLSWAQAFAIGVAQGLAIVPGVSRSGITITAALALGLRREEAVRFSFLMLMPITLGAGLLKSKYLISNIGDASVWVALVSSFLFGIAAIHILISYVRSKSFIPFVVYRLALAASIGAWLWLH